MDQTKKTDKPFVDEEDSGFDIMEWVSAFLHHWYLFVIGIVISLAVANLINRKWIASYKTSGTMIIEEYRASSSTQALMQGFGVQSGYKNVQNQVIMLGSYDLISRVVDSLPQLKVEYLSKGKFKTRNLYNNSPIQIQTRYVAPEAYGLLFKIDIDNNGKYVITVDDNKQYDDFRLEGQLGEPLSNNLFFIVVNSAYSYSEKREMYFRFADKESVVSDFMSRIKFQYVVEGSSVLEISLEGQTPDRDVDFINKLSETFLADNLERKNDAANKTIKFIDEQLSNVSQSLAVSQDQMTAFRKENQILDVSTHAGELLGKATQFDTEQAALKLRETYFNYLSNYLKNNIESGSVVAPSSIGVNEPTLMGLISQLNELNQKRSELSDKNMYYAKYSREIDNIKISIEELIKNMQAALSIEKNDFYKRYNKVQKEINELPQKEIEMVSLERRYKMDDNYYTFFLQKRAEAEILKSSNTPDNNILDRARVMYMTNGDKPSKNLMLYLLIGILIPALIIVLKELLNGTLRSNLDVEKNSPYDLIGVVRRTKSADPLLIVKNPRSSFTEMFRVIRTRIEFLLKRKKDMMIMITSGESGDGKTYFSINLANIYGMASQSTVLVDMDIRKPSINRSFNLDNTDGVTNYLIGQCELDDVILKLPDVNFDILPAGTVPPNAGELIRSDKLQEMFAELRRRYDYIIVDTSPIGIVADAYALAQMADINLYVVRNEKTNKSFFKRLTSQLKADEFENFYTVLNDVNMEGKKYYRYNSKKYAYGYNYGSYYTNRKNKKLADNYFQYYQDDRDI